MQAQHLVEVAVVEQALPVDAEQLAAHHGVEVVPVVAVAQQLHVALEAALAEQRAAEALDGHVGQYEQVVEADAEVQQQLALVVGLQRPLRWRQHGALRVVDEVEHQARGRGRRSPAH
jgi:Fe2+ transport system protein B